MVGGVGRHRQNLKKGVEMKRWLLFLVALGAFSLLAVKAFALTADEIMKKAYHVQNYLADDERVHVEMKIIDSQGRTRNRVITMLRKDMDQEDKEQKYFVYFMEPPDVEGMTYMVWKHIGRDDDRWLYLPALDLVRRIAASDKRSSFVGSDFVYEDISGRNIDEDVHELVDETDTQYVVKCTPKKPELVEFSYFKVYVDKKTFIPMKKEYFDKNGKLYRKLEVLESKEIQGFPTITKGQAINLETGGKTEITFSNVEYNIGIPDDIFTERYLRRPPRKWLK